MAHLIKAITSDHDLIELAERINVHLDGIFVSSEITKPIPKKGTFVILLRPEGRDVGHWTCVHDGFYFDSMGEGPPTKYRIRKYSDKQYQGAYNNFCGVFVLLWLYCQQKNRMELLDRFRDLNLTIL